MTLKTDLRAIARLCGDPDAPASVAAPGVLPASGSYPLRLRWTTAAYGPMRNAAWLVRNSRHRSQSNPIALSLVVQEAHKLHLEGEPMMDIFEAFAELLRTP